MRRAWVARSAAVTERGKEYVRGLRVLGAGDWRILLLFAAPNILPPIAFVAVLDVARMMIFESILGFLGLGIQPPTPSFGSIIADSRKYLINAWWIATAPGVFLALTLTSINLMGAALERARLGDRGLQGEPFVDHQRLVAERPVEVVQRCFPGWPGDQRENSKRRETVGHVIRSLELRLRQHGASVWISGRQ